MSQQVYKFSLSTINHMKKSYETQLIGTPQGAVFRAKTDHAVITAYRSGKVLFQGNSPETEIAKWGTTKQSNHTAKQSTKKVKANPFNPPSTLFTNSHIGSDESGTGDYFGPVTVAAVYVQDHQIELLKELGIQDSKKITDERVRALSKDIIQLELPYSLLILHNKKYNTLQQQGWSQGKIKAMLHHHAIDHVVNKIADAPYHGILIDQFCQPHVYKRYIASEQATMAKGTYFMTKAEHYSIAVAAGSILARASFLNEMDKLSEKIGYPLLKGASNKVDQLIATIIKAQGIDSLDHCAKTHFINTKKAQAYL
ncbi:MAG TPA: ribonuclease HIII [Virgibacillus sp.]|nr:ribonuclease HIII [Virgibacillus sp.]